MLEIEEVKQRLAELEERQDFTERMLTRARERGDLGPPGGARDS
jgi:tetrahydromethanopterin S-methyltransferase subunit G